MLATLEQEDRTRNKSVSKNGGEDREQDCVKMSGNARAGIREQVGAGTGMQEQLVMVCLIFADLVRVGVYYTSTNADV